MQIQCKSLNKRDYFEHFIERRDIRVHFAHTADYTPCASIRIILGEIYFEQISQCKLCCRCLNIGGGNCFFAGDLNSMIFDIISMRLLSYSIDEVCFRAFHQNQCFKAVEIKPR